MVTMALSETLTLREAADLWDIDASTIRHAIKNNRFEVNVEVRKSRDIWLITQEAMSRLFGPLSQMANVYTIGYEGKSIEDFVNLLLRKNIHTLFDVREYPLSRKHGFSKNVLANYLGEHGIRYHLFRELGSPKEMRDQLHQTKNYLDFFAAYEKWLGSQPETFEIIKTAISENVDMRFCLMCFEKNPAECHRSVIAQKLVDESRYIGDIVNL